MEHSPREKVLWGIGTIVVLFYALVPVIWILSLSFKDPTTIGDGKFFPSKWTWDNYDSVFSTGFFTSALRNSIGIALIATVLSLIFASMAAYAITRLDFPGKTLILAGALAIAMFPPISVVGGLFDIWRRIGLYDTWLGLILPYMSFALPLSIYTLSAFFREIPWDLEKAAQIDGATPLQAFRKVILPLAMPGVFTAGILTFIAAVERLPVRQRPDVDRRLTDRAGGAGVLPGAIPVHRPERRDRGGSRGRDHPDSHHGADLPATDRLRPHRGRRQGLKELQWRTSSWTTSSSGTPTASRPSRT
jgi:multiple sugar transport system permease protein